MRNFLVPLFLATAYAPVEASADDGDLASFGAVVGSQIGSSPSGDAWRGPQPSVRPDSDGSMRPERLRRTVPLAGQPMGAVGALDPSDAVNAGQPQSLQVDAPVRRRPRTVTVFGSQGEERPRDRDSDGTLGRLGSPQGGVVIHRNVDRRDGTFEGRVLDSHRRRDGDHRWTGDWRRDHRYDWRGHRDRHRWVFRTGNYYDPYGWGYRPFSIGYRLWPSYYRSSFWLNDPWMYRLPAAYGRYRWIRYYNDALLVDIHSGRVIDVIHGFFW
ncbi:MAG TPA: RcnB family protein [Sphingomicrobium sp.]|nr:RcnB family protein [Sphingomicrobium sp.]